jgi:hypothetical protein
MCPQASPLAADSGIAAKVVKLHRHQRGRRARLWVWGRSPCHPGSDGTRSCTALEERCTSRTGGGGTCPAAAVQTAGCCSRGHRRLRQCPRRTLDRPDTGRPDIGRRGTGRLDTDRGSGSGSGQDSHGVRGVGCRNSLDTGRVSGCLAGCGRTAVDRRRRSAATAAPQVALARLRWSSGPGRRGRRMPAVRTRGHRPRPVGHGVRTPRHCGYPRRRQGHVDTAQWPRWTAGSRPVRHRSRVRPERDRSVRRRPAPA